MSFSITYIPTTALAINRTACCDADNALGRTPTFLSPHHLELECPCGGRHEAGLQHAQDELRQRPAQPVGAIQHAHCRHRGPDPALLFRDLQIGVQRINMQVRGRGRASSRRIPVSHGWVCFTR